MQEQVEDEELNPAPSEGLDQAQRSWFSDLHAASSQHGFAGVSSVTSPAQEDPQSRRICNMGWKRMHHAERQKQPGPRKVKLHGNHSYIHHDLKKLALYLGTKMGVSLTA